MRRPSTSHGRRNTRSRSGRPFKLSHIEGLVWLPDPDDSGVILNSGEVQTLPDSTTPSEDATQTTATNQPTFVATATFANSRSLAKFVASNSDFLTAGDNHAPKSSSFSLFAPVRMASDAVGQIVRKRGTSAGGSESGWYLGFSGDNALSQSVFRVYVEDTGGRGLVESGATSSSLIDGSMHLVEMHYDSGPGRIRVAADRSVLGSSSSGSLTNISGVSHLCLGCAWDAAANQSSFFDGWIGKCALYIRDGDQASLINTSDKLADVRDHYTSLYGTP